MSSIDLLKHERGRENGHEHDYWTVEVSSMEDIVQVISFKTFSG